MSSPITKGPVLPFDAANTNRKCNKICDLLALLDMGNKEEQIDFKRILRDYMCRSLESRDGHDRDHLQELTEGDVRLFATRFLDNEKISPSYQTAGMTFWPSYTFIPFSGPGPRPKKWTYAENRNGIIDFVAQIIVTQRENRKKNELDKTRPRHRKRTCDERASSGRECHQAHPTDISEDDLDHDPSFFPAPKRPRTSVKSASRTSNPQVGNVSDVVNPSQMLRHVDPAIKQPEEHCQSVTISTAPPHHTSRHASSIEDTSGGLQNPDSARQESQLELGSAAMILEMVKKHENAMDTTKERVYECNDAATQTLPGLDQLTPTVKAELLSQGVMQAQKQVLKIYSKLHIDAEFSHGAEAERLAMKAKVLLDAAKELVAALEQPGTASTIEGCSRKRCGR